MTGRARIKILKYLFVCCLNIFLGNFPRFSVLKSFKILEKYIANFFKGCMNYLRTNQTSSQVHLVPCVPLQFTNSLEKQTSKKIYFFINPGKYYLPIWKDKTTLLKMHAQHRCILCGCLRKKWLIVLINTIKIHMHYGPGPICSNGG